MHTKDSNFTKNLNVINYHLNYTIQSKSMRSTYIKWGIYGKHTGEVQVNILQIVIIGCVKSYLYQHCH